MIPLRDDNPTTLQPVVTIALIVAASVVFLWQLTLSPMAEVRIAYALGVVPITLLGDEQPALRSISQRSPGIVRLCRPHRRVRLLQPAGCLHHSSRVHPFRHKRGILLRRRHLRGAVAAVRRQHAAVHGRLGQLLRQRPGPAFVLDHPDRQRQPQPGRPD